MFPDLSIQSRIFFSVFLWLREGLFHSICTGPPIVDQPQPTTPLLTQAFVRRLSRLFENGPWGPVLFLLS